MNDVIGETTVRYKANRLSVPGHMLDAIIGVRHQEQPCKATATYSR